MTILDYVYGTSEGKFAIIPQDFVWIRWFDWPQDREYVEKYIELRSDEDVYFTTTLYNDTERTAEHATVGWAVYADADTCHPDNFRLTPTFSNETSPGKWHCFWVLDEEKSAKELSDLSRLIATAHRDQGCDAGWIESKILRIPGTTNTKYEEKYTVQESSSGITYTADQIREAYSDIVIDTTNYVDATMPTELPSVFDAADKIPETLWPLYADIPHEGASWSERLWKFELDLFREGLSREEVFVLAKNAKCNKYERDGRPDSALWTEVLRASVHSTDGVIVNLEPEFKPKAVPIVFLSDEEREFVRQNPGFPAEYEAWVKTRSAEAAPTYQRSLAYILLSCVYGEYGYIIPQMGDMDLNLWVLILGDTTKTRKSTSRGLMLTLLHAWEARIGDGKTIDIGSDFTAEGLNKVLGQRDGMVSLVHRDEVQGFIHQAQQKSYMAGTIQTLTELYDGKVQVSLRSSKDAGQANRAATTFNFLGLGIREEMGKLMTAKDFQSGFLTRFLWSIADNPKWTPESEYVGQRDITKEKSRTDAKVTEFVQHFTRVRAKFGKSNGAKTPIIMAPEVHARWMQWKMDSARLAQSMENSALIDPARDRMSWSLWKAAALLAIHDLSETIEMRHLLPVLAQAEEWFEHMVRMANTVADSAFQSRLTEIEKFISSGANHTVPKSKLIGKFGRKVEVDELLDNLYAQGRIIKDNTAGTITALVVD